MSQLLWLKYAPAQPSMAERSTGKNQRFFLIRFTPVSACTRMCKQGIQTTACCRGLSALKLRQGRHGGRFLFCLHSTAKSANTTHSFLLTRKVSRTVFEHNKTVKFGVFICFKAIVFTHVDVILCRLSITVERWPSG